MDFEGIYEDFREVNSWLCSIDDKLEVLIEAIMDKKIKEMQKGTKKLQKQEKELLKADKKRDMGEKMMKSKKK